MLGRLTKRDDAQLSNIASRWHLDDMVFSSIIVSLLLVVAPTTKFKNCDALRLKFKSGVAATAKAAAATGATLNAKVYAANKGLDRDKDGAACEK